MTRIVIMVAMEEEAQYLKPLVGGVKPVTMPGVEEVTRGNIDGVDIDIVISGIGAVNAASATTAALLYGPCAAVLSCGCSGAHVTGQKLGDIVLGSHVRPLDPVVIARDGTTRYSGVRYSMTEKGTLSFPADVKLLELAKQAAESVRGSGSEAMRIDVGIVGSGDAWRQCPDTIKQVHTKAGSLCEEMEAHAVAQVCARFNVPFLAIKDIANSELEPDDIQLEPTHHIVPDAVKVGYNAALVTADTVRRLVAETAKRPANSDEGAGRAKCPRLTETSVA